MKIKTLFIVFAVALVAISAQAETVTLSWVPGPLAEGGTNLVKYRIHAVKGVNGIFTPIGPQYIEVLADKTMATYSVGVGQWRFHVTAIDSANQESAPSNFLIVEVTPTLPTKPNPPTGLIRVTSP